MMKYFNVLRGDQEISSLPGSAVYLIEDSWDDWFKYSTQYYVIYVDDDGGVREIGSVKVGQFGMAENQRRADIPAHFDVLDDKFFSLGQDDSFYDELNELGPTVRDKILRGLRGVALDLELFNLALAEKVTGTSLLRSVARSTVTGQFHRMARGGARLSRYEFSYTLPHKDKKAALKLGFVVEPGSYPPTNIHVLIGRNGVGKTTILNHMTHSVVNENAKPEVHGAFSVGPFDFSNVHVFSNIVSVTFSAFDPFEPLSDRQDRSAGVRYAYIGLKRVRKRKEGPPLAPKTPERLSQEFSNSVSLCRSGARASRWRRALEVLESDPIFRDAEVASLASPDIDLDEKQFKALARELFSRLSSGHKIVLLTITRLVETVEEKTLVLLDEPEAHLHPPLLSAFVRALSELLIDRNGVAVVATHSPVVLQEVPKSCVWKIRRAGSRSGADRPEIETFGENVGILTREVFGLEVTHSGFHQMLRGAVASNFDFEAVVNRFGGEIGGEARAIIQALIAARDYDEGSEL